MTPDNVTLIVKAPNQQIEDQNIQCQSSWTVRQLKGHLSEVYPSKPRTEEQKIIYSGQLLDDNTVLKDVLRIYENQLAHTMHLVCSPKRMAEPQKTNPEIGKDGLRRRNVEVSQSGPETNTAPVTETARPEMRQNDQNHTVEMQNYLSSFVNNYGRVPPYPNYNLGDGYLPVPNDPSSMANHMMMMQQAYMQYMQQYANMWQATANAQAQPATASAPQREAPPAAPAAPVAPPAPEEADEARAPRDWLDDIYAGSRIAILLSLVYLYGSPARLLLVLFLVAAGYLHQIGFFRDMQLNPANANRRREENRARDEQQPNADQPPNQPEPDATTETNRNNQVEENQSLLAVTWMIFTSFFASLIPDTN